MRVGVIRFPGSNCDQDALYSLREDIGIQADYVWHEETSLNAFDAVFLPGGFSYGDYLRCGAIASRAPIMAEVHRFAANGYPVIAACNGFQVLCEAGILPGALVQNVHEKFICKHIFLRAEQRVSMWTSGVDRVLRIPIAHGEGRYIVDEETLNRLEDNAQIAFRYVNELGEATEEANVNGSVAAIAGVLNEKGNVLGLMPHPERATKAILGSIDGLAILNGLHVLEAVL